MRKTIKVLTAFVLITALAAAGADNALKDELKDPDLAAHWIYDDLPKAVSEAKASGKPICMTLRCVPCVAGKKLDGEITHPNAALEALQKNFVCVRVIKTQGLDLKQYQFDMDQSLACFFLNADGTIYGRYGTRAGNGPNSDNFISLPSFKKAMERALELHKNYPANKAELSGKVATQADYPVPEAIPGLTDRANQPVVRKNCIHCHMVRESTLRTKWTEKKLARADLFVYPMPDTIGLTTDVNDGLKVKQVRADSPAAKAGIEAGDELTSLNGQRLISIADIQWVLQNAPNDSTLKAAVMRGEKSIDKTIALSGNWKESDFTWRASTFALRRGFRTDPLSADEKKKRGIADDQMALLVKNVGADAAKALGKDIKNGDVIVGIDGKTSTMTEAQFLSELRLNHGPTDKVKLTVLRGDQRKEVTAPMW